MHVSPLLAWAVLGLLAWGPAASAQAPAGAAKADDLAEVKKGVEEVKKATDDAKARGDTAWVLASSGLVMLMLPGLALFYGGMVRRKNVLATMMQSMAALAVVGLYWVVAGYALAFGPSMLRAPDGVLGVNGGGLIGWGADLFCFKGVTSGDERPANDIPVYLHVVSQR